MIVDVSSTAGFSLQLDTDRLDLVTSPELRFKRHTRLAHQLESVLRTPDAVDSEREMYYTFYLEEAAGPIQQTLAEMHLTYSPVLLPPGQVAGEYVKTTGHYHPPMPGSTRQYPEIYLQLYGSLLLLMQKRTEADPDTLEACWLVEMTPGFAINMPSGYAHALINHTNQPALMAGLYSPDFKPVYEPVRARRGMAYYIVEGENGPEELPNPHYQNPPPLQKLLSVDGTPFAPPYPGLPVWQAFLNDPQAYAFLSSPVGE